MQVERVRNLSATDFRKSYFLTERPVIITDAIDHWPARELWNPEYPMHQATAGSPSLPTAPRP
jgi:hypothetical protein